MAGEIVRAEDDSGAKLMLADNSILDVGASSSLKIESFVPNSGPDREVVVGVESGKVRASIKKKIEGRGKFLIRTRASVLAVRGTELVVDVGNSPGSRESVFVKEGNVLAEFAGGGGKVVIPEGRRLDAQTSGGGFSVRPSDFKVGAVDKTEMTGAFNRATIVDRSFLQNIQIRENDDLFRGRATVQTLAMNFKAPPPLPPGWRPDAGQLIKDQAPPKLDHPGSLRRNGADQQIDIGGNNVTEVNVSVIFKP